MTRDILPPAPTMGGQQMPGAQAPHSALAAAMMSQPGMPMGNGAMPGGPIPLSTLMQLMEKGGDSPLMNGIGNWLHGYQWDGMAGGGMLDKLSGQAAANAAQGLAL